MSAQYSRKIVLLDLDGTLTKSDPGILASVRYAYRHNGVPVPDDKTLNSFIGPAIMTSMLRCGVSRQQLPAMIRSYREAYSNEDVFDDPEHPGQKVPGKFLNSVYPGIPQALNNLRNDGYDLYVCTAKPEYQAKPICDRFALTELVDGVYGASEDDTRIRKDQVVAYTLEQINYQPDNDELTVMVGDRWTDVEGARKGGHLETIGARWGYADPGELEEHGAVMIAETTADLEQTVNKYFDSKAAETQSQD
jgi:phosphoglycolate phosphatase